MAEQAVAEEPAAEADADTETATDVPDAELEAQAPPVEDAPAPPSRLRSRSPRSSPSLSTTPPATPTSLPRRWLRSRACAQPGPARPARKKGRPSVPSWDDVVFGAKPRD